MARDEQTAFPVLSPRQIERLAEFGAECEAAVGERLFAEGDRHFDLYVVLEGEVEIVEHSSGEERRVTVHGPGEFTGDVDMLTGRATLVTAVVRRAGRLLRVRCGAVQEIVSTIPELSDVLLRGFLMRRQLLREGGFVGLKIYGPRDSRAAYRLEEMANRNHVPYTRYVPAEDAKARRALAELGVEPGEEEAVVVRAGEVYRDPSVAEIAAAVGLDLATELRSRYDLIVVGAGPAGLAATVYAASEGLSTLLVDSIGLGGQAGTSSKIENYLGFPAGLSGSELADRAMIQALKFGADIAAPVTACGLLEDDGPVLVLGDGREARCRALLVATGAHYRRLPIAGIRRFEDRGVYYAATDAEARLCSDRDVVVVGGGNSAGQAAMFLAERARRVVLAVRGESLEDTMSQYLIERLEESEAVEIATGTEVVELAGERSLEGLVLAGPDGTRRTVDAATLFVFVGTEPHSGWLPDAVERDDEGFVRVGSEVAIDDDRRPRLAFETSLDRVFAAGDVRSGSIKRVAAAVGEGAMVVQSVHLALATG